jgi:hypothetical protein
MEELFAKSLGVNFIFQFLQPNIHESTVLIVLTLVSKILREPSSAISNKFRYG